MRDLGWAIAAYELRERLRAVGSATGRQLEALRDRLPARASAGRNHREELLVRSLQVLDQLTPEEDEVARLRLTGFSEGHRTYERLVPAVEAQLVTLDDGPPALITRAGEEVVASAQDEDGHPIPGFLRVRGKRRVLMSYEAIGRQLGQSTWWVRERWSAAATKLRRAGASKPLDEDRLDSLR